MPSGQYSHAIEVKLQTNIPDADIFYYTDGKGYFETISIYKKPILLTKNTQLDFFAMTPDMNQTPIYTHVYTFSYSHAFDVSVSDSEILVKNTTSSEQNLGLRIVETQNMSYEVTNNTIIAPGNTFTLPYSPQSEETIFLYSPDGVVKDSFDVKLMKQTHSQITHTTPSSSPILSQPVSSPVPDTPKIHTKNIDTEYSSVELVSQENIENTLDDQEDS